jgi:hypothetical protein
MKQGCEVKQQKPSKGLCDEAHWWIFILNVGCKWTGREAASGGDMSHSEGCFSLKFGACQTTFWYICTEAEGAAAWP